jgi:hypothetical protein
MLCEELVQNILYLLIAEMIRLNFDVGRLTFGLKVFFNFFDFISEPFYYKGALRFLCFCINLDQGLRWLDFNL